MKIVALLLLLTIVANVNGWSYKDLTIKDIRGTWNASYPSPVAIVSELNSGNSAQATCRSTLPKSCERTLPDIIDVFIIDSDGTTLDTEAIVNPRKFHFFNLNYKI